MGYLISLLLPLLDSRLLLLATGGRNRGRLSLLVVSSGRVRLLGGLGRLKIS